MKEVIFDYNDYKTKNETYKDFYRDIVKKLNNFIDFEGDEDLSYNVDIFNEFMWYNHAKNLKIVMLNFDLNKIAKQKTADDYHWGVIFRILERFVKNFPNNTLEYRNE